MRTIYAVQLDLGQPHLQDQSPFERVIELSLDWCRSNYDQGLPVEALTAEGRMSPAPGHSLQRVLTQCSDGSTLWQLLWSYPSKEDARTLRRCEVTAAQVQDRLQVAVVLRLASAEHVVAPYRYDLRRPRLVHDLAENFSCTAGTQKVQTQPLELTAEDVNWFVEEVLYDKDRRLPIVLVTPTGFSGPPLVDPKGLSNTLLGLAQVWHALDRDATWKLTDALGEERACFNGAVRTYWPGFERHSDPFQHPLLLPGRLAQIGMVGAWMLRGLAGMSALRFVEGEVIRHAQDCARSDRRSQIETLRTRAGSADEGYKILELLMEENEKLRLQVGDLEAKCDDLEQEVAVLGAGAATAELEYTAEPAAPTTVLEALERAEKDNSDVLMVSGKARKAAEKSDYRDPARAYRVLCSLADIYRRKFAGPLGCSLTEAFRQHHLEYKADIGTVTRGQYDHQYQCEYEGRKYPIVEHITLKGQPNTGTLSVHWAELKGRSQILVGHVGQHLDVATW